MTGTLLDSLSLPQQPLPNRHRLVHLGLGRRPSTCRTRARPSLLLKDLPELEVLVGRGRGQCLTIGAQRAVQDARLVGRDLDIADKGGIAPDADRVDRGAGRAGNLTVVRGPAEAGDLRASVDAVEDRKSVV